MRQKLAVANALLPRPALLVLDEPTAGVDVLARADIWAMLNEYPSLALTRARAEALVLLSTSYLDEAAACDRLVYLDAGRVVATGSPEELRAAAQLELYRAWGDDAQAIARAARALPYVGGARATGRFARIEVLRPRSPGTRRVLADLEALPAGGVRLAEEVPPDMESTLLALAQQAGT
jgi:ABC-type multidrug transport system ATPase subunit